MAHQYQFEDAESTKSILSRDEIIDFIEMFYRWGDSTFNIIISDKGGNTCGNHIYNAFAKRHSITLFPKALRNVIDKKRSIGGNHKFENEKIGMAAVLTHELQHANQAAFHKHEGIFYGNTGKLTPTGKSQKKQYQYRACEREARAFVDDHTNEIYAYFAAPPPMRRLVTVVGKDQDELVAVADVLCEVSDPTVDDIRDELRASKQLNPTNYAAVVKILTDRGIKVSR